MKTQLVLTAAAVLLASGTMNEADAQSRGVRGVGWRPAGTGSTASGSTRATDPRSGAWGPSGATPRDRGWTDSRFPADRTAANGGIPGRWPHHRPRGHGHIPHHGACFGHHGLHVGAHFGSAFVIFVGQYAYPTYAYVAPYSLRYSAGGSTTLLQGDLGDAAAALAVDHLPGGVVRLTWRPDGRAVEEVGLFLADSQQTVLAVQTLRSAPFTALFEPTSAARYVGITIAYADGQNTTTLLPLRGR